MRCSCQRTLIYFVKGSIMVQLVSSLTEFDSVKQENRFFLFEVNPNRSNWRTVIK